MYDQEHIIQAAIDCFREPGPAPVARLEALLAADPDEVMRQSLLILQTANAAVDEEGRQMAELLLAQGLPLVCKPGCTGCCHQLVLCQPFEARNIHLYLEAHEESLRHFQAAYPLWDAATAAMRQSYLAWAVRRYQHNEDDGSHSLTDSAPCPFLNNEGSCVIYPVRPYGCRTCVAYDPACATPAVGKSGALHKQYSLYTKHHEVRMAVTHVLLRHLPPDVTSSAKAMPERLAELCLV